MLKLNWFWSELNRRSPRSVEVCAAVWQMKGARKALTEIYLEAFQQMEEAGMVQDDLALIHPDVMLAKADLKYKKQRRWAWGSLLAVGAVLTFQPWFEISWFSTVILIAGVMLCVLEFIPSSGEGFVAMAMRHRKSKR